MRLLILFAICFALLGCENQVQLDESQERYKEEITEITELYNISNKVEQAWNDNPSIYSSWLIYYYINHDTELFYDNLNVLTELIANKEEILESEKEALCNVFGLLINESSRYLNDNKNLFNRNIIGNPDKIILSLEMISKDNSIEIENELDFNYKGNLYLCLYNLYEITKDEINSNKYLDLVNDFAKKNADTVIYNK